MTSLKQLNLEQVRQKNGLLHVGHRQTDDLAYLGFAGEYLDQSQNKLFYSGLLRDKDPLNDKKFVLFDRLELSPFTNDIDFKNAQKADLEVKNILTTGSVEFQRSQTIDPDSSDVINPLNHVLTFEIAAVTINDIFVVINNVYTQINRNPEPADYFHLLFDNSNITNDDYILVKNQINLNENGIYKVSIREDGGTYFKRINDETTALNSNSPIEVVITTEDNDRLVRYGTVDPVYYKIKSYLNKDNKLQVEFVLYSGLSQTTYQNGNWDMQGDTTIGGELVVNKSLTLGDSITIGKGLYESVMNLTSEVDDYEFNLNGIEACIYRCDSSVRAMTITLPDIILSSGRNIKIIKVDSSDNAVEIIPVSGQAINNIVDETIVLTSKSDHIKFTCDGYDWYTM